MRTAILTISSSLARGEGDDLSAPALADAATSGVAGGTLIVKMPGNPKAIDESLPVLAPILGHAARQIGRRGGRSDGEH